MIAIPSEYKGYKMRSFLEKRIAMKLDELNVDWLYEPQGFKMNDGTCYLPDFYLPKLHIWIEGKGILTEEDAHKIECLGIENEANEPVLVVFSDGKTILIGKYRNWITDTPDDDHINIKFKGFNEVFDGFTSDNSDFFLNKCRNCNRYSIVSGANDYTCIHNNCYDGDHFLNPIISENDNFFDLKSL